MWSSGEQSHDRDAGAGESGEGTMESRGADGSGDGGRECVWSRPTGSRASLQQGRRAAMFVP